MRTYGRLMRLSLAPTAAADIAVGIVWGGAGHWPAAGSAPWRLVLASLCIVHGAMILNDWSDRGGDGITRPDRPIPSGAVTPRTALRLGTLLLAAGPLLAGSVAAGLLWPAAGLSLLAAGYDLGLRGPLLGPLLLATCRAGNLGLGWLAGSRLAESHVAESHVAGAPVSVQGALPVLLYFGYVFFVARLGRLEDDEDPRPLGNRPRAYLLGAATCLALAPLALLSAFGMSFGLLAGLALSVGGAFPLLREALADEPWDRPRIGRNMGRALRRLLVFTASLALVTLERSFATPEGSWDGLWVCLAVLTGYPISFALRRVFPPS